MLRFIIIKDKIFLQVLRFKITFAIRVKWCPHLVKIPEIASKQGMNSIFKSALKNHVVADDEASLEGDQNRVNLKPGIVFRQKRQDMPSWRWCHHFRERLQSVR